MKKFLEIPYHEKDTPRVLTINPDGEVEEELIMIDMLADLEPMDGWVTEDDGIGHYEFWGSTGYDSHPYRCLKETSPTEDVVFFIHSEGKGILDAKSLQDVAKDFVGEFDRINDPESDATARLTLDKVQVDVPSQTVSGTLVWDDTI